jgi:hypothetical protein
LFPSHVSKQASKPGKIVSFPRFSKVGNHAKQISLPRFPKVGKPGNISAIIITLGEQSIIENLLGNIYLPGKQKLSPK